MNTEIQDADFTVVEESQVNTPIDTASKVDPFEYGYKAGTKIELPAEFMKALIEFTGAVTRQEMKQEIVLDSFLVSEGPKLDENGIPVKREEVVKVSTSVIGKQAETIFNSLMDVHVNNINSGKAMKDSDLQKPTLED